MNKQYIAIGGFSIALAAGCGAAGDSPEKGILDTDSQSSTIPGFNYYCSSVNTSTHGWHLLKGNLDANACSGASGEKVMQEGMYSTTGQNTAVARCDPNFYWVYAGWGSDPLNWAFDAASASNNSGGCVFTVTPGWTLPPAAPGPSPGCADGTVEQSFGTTPDGRQKLVGCAGHVTWDKRATLCAPGWSVASATQWQAVGQGLAPTHNYWTNDYLGWSTAGYSGNCATSLAFSAPNPGTNNAGFASCGGNDNMHVTTPWGSDAEGNSSNWVGCGLNGTANTYLGGCSSSAGTLCRQDSLAAVAPPLNPAKIGEAAFVNSVAAQLNARTDQSVPTGYQIALYDPQGVLVQNVVHGYAGSLPVPPYAWLPMTSDRRMDIASASKTITGIAVMAALDDQRQRGTGVTLDSSIVPYLPKNWVIPASVKGITFRSLLTHTSGLPEIGISPIAGQNLYANLKADIAAGPCLPGNTTAGAQGSIPTCNPNGSPLTVPLGQYQYSNAGIALLRIALAYLVDGPAFYASYEAGPLMEDLTANSYRNFVKTRVLDPIGLSAVDVFWTGTWPETQYVAPGNQLPPRTDNDINPALGEVLQNERTAGPGCWTLSAVEFGKLLSSVRLGKVISQAAYNEMTEDQLIPTFNPNGIGVGMFSTPAPQGLGIDWDENGGGQNVTGPSAQWMIFANGYTAVFIANTGLSAGSLGYGIMEQALSDALIP